MSVFTIALAAVLAGEPDPTALVARLGTAAEADRAAVAAQLEALGFGALPALRAAQSAKDPETRRRASALLERIETGLLLRPSLVVLGFQEKSVADVVQSVSAQTGIALVLEPPGDPAWRAVRLDLSEPRPLPFWEALDRIAIAARLHHNPAFARGVDERAPVFHLQEGSAPFPKSFSGPFRVNLVSVHRRHAIELETQDTDAEDEPDAERFEVVAQVFAEPRFMITLNGPPKELKARDDFDQDLVPPVAAPADDADAEPEPAAPAGIERGPGPVPGALSVVQFPIALHAPERPGTTIVHLAGFLPLQVARRRPDPLTITLAEATGRTFETAELALRFPERKPPPGMRVPLELFIRLKPRPDALTPDDSPAPVDFPEPRPVDTLQNRLEIVDAQRRPLAYTVKDIQTDDSGESRVLVTLAGRDTQATAVALRVYGLIAGAIEVPFKFAKVPMP